MSKFWLIGMTQNRRNDIFEIIQYGDKYFDGLVYVDHFSTDGTYEQLEIRKRSGLIIQRNYVKQHSHSQNEIFFCRHIKNGDWVFLNDSAERITEFWLSQLRSQIEEFNKTGVGSVYFSGRPYLWKYFDNQQFYNSPHWGVGPLYGKSITFGEENKNKYIINNRDNNKVEHYAIHPIFYWFCHSPSNETQIMYGKYGQDVVNERENIRMEFRIRCEQELGLSLNTLDDLINFYKQGKYPDWFIECTENEFRLSELFQLKVLNLDFMTTMHPRNQWSFKHYLKTGEISQKHLGYKGTIILLNEKYNIYD